MVLVISIPLRQFYNLKHLVTAKHLDNMAKVMLAAGLSVSYGYLMDSWGAWYKNEPYDSYIYTNRFSGPNAEYYWALVVCNCVIPQLLWFPSVRRHPLTLFGIALVINVGMWLERLIIISLSLTRDYLPSTWSTYTPTFWDWSLYAGTFGLFVTLMFLFLRILPAISMAEMRELVHEQHEDRRAEERQSSDDTQQESAS